MHLLLIVNHKRAYYAVQLKFNFNKMTPLRSFDIANDSDTTDKNRMYTMSISKKTVSRKLRADRAQKCYDGQVYNPKMY